MTTHTSKGYTLVEVLLVVAIAALLMTLSIPVYRVLKEKASYAGCVSHLRILHTGFTTYLSDHEMIWPQVPELSVGDETKEYKWWVETLGDYGVSRKQWVCPADRDLNDETDLPPGEFRGSYIPTLFDEFPNTAFRWKQPWVIERGGLHGSDKGPNMLMPDGTVQEGPAMMGN
jgi:prepilin-type N-terminal cleavage/methylation domain-containing protein